MSERFAGPPWPGQQANVHDHKPQDECPENCPVNHPEWFTDEWRSRAAEGRCQQCGNWPTICGHGLPFKERMKTVRANYIGWSETR